MIHTYSLQKLHCQNIPSWLWNIICQLTCKSLLSLSEIDRSGCGGGKSLKRHVSERFHAAFCNIPTFGTPVDMLNPNK